MCTCVCAKRFIKDLSNSISCGWKQTKVSLINPPLCRFDLELKTSIIFCCTCEDLSWRSPLDGTAGKTSLH